MPKDDLPIRGFDDAADLGRWLAAHHGDAAGIWLRSQEGRQRPGTELRRGGGRVAALRVIDGQKGRLDEAYYLQRLTPRGPRSRWSKVNRRRAERLIEEGRMAAPGMAQVVAARGDGRWDAAYDSHRTATVPADLQAALDADPAAKAFFARLSSANRYAILYRVEEAKRAETRARRVEKFVAMCARGETIH